MYDIGKRSSEGSGFNTGRIQVLAHQPSFSAASLIHDFLLQTSSSMFQVFRINSGAFLRRIHLHTPVAPDDSDNASAGSEQEAADNDHTISHSRQTFSQLVSQPAERHQTISFNQQSIS